MKIKQLSFSWKIFVAFQHLLTRFKRPLFKFMIPNYFLFLTSPITDLDTKRLVSYNFFLSGQIQADNDLFLQIYSYILVYLQRFYSTPFA